MLICKDCVNELKDEYLEKIKKEKGLKYAIERQHSKIKSQLLDDDDKDSRFSYKSYYTNNNDYIPKNDKRNKSKYEDNISVHSYNEIITDYSKRRRKNKIKNHNKDQKPFLDNFIHGQEELNNNFDNENKRRIQDRYDDKEIYNNNEIFNEKDKDNIYPKKEKDLIKMKKKMKKKRKNMKIKIIIIMITKIQIIMQEKKVKKILIMIIKRK